MIFIRPKILRDQSQAAYETDLKYNYMQDEQRGFQRREILPLLPDKQPVLPNLPPPPPAGTQAAPISSEEKERAAERQQREDDALNRRGPRSMGSKAPAPELPQGPSNGPPSLTPGVNGLDSSNTAPNAATPVAPGVPAPESRATGSQPDGGKR